MKLLSRVLIVCGLLLLAFWLVARIHSKVSSTAAVASFPAPRKTRAIAPANGVQTMPSQPLPLVASTTADMSLWSKVRVQGFEESLRIKTEPPIAILSVPGVGIEAPLYRGTDEVTLNRGLGWIEGTAFPGSKGNTGIAAHRDGFFRALKDIGTNDVIELATPIGVQTLTVSRCEIVLPSNVDVLAPTTEQNITLVTCYPFYHIGSAPQRLIVHAVRNEGTAQKYATGTCPRDQVTSQAAITPADRRN